MKVEKRFRQPQPISLGEPLNSTPDSQSAIDGMLASPRTAGGQISICKSIWWWLVWLRVWSQLLNGSLFYPPARLLDCQQNKRLHDCLLWPSSLWKTWREVNGIIKNQDPINKTCISWHLLVCLYISLLYSSISCVRSWEKGHLKV